MSCTLKCCFSNLQDELTYFICNEAYKAFLGKSDDEDVIGKTDAVLFSAEQAEQFKRMDDAALETDQIVVTEMNFGDRIYEIRKFLNHNLLR